MGTAATFEAATIVGGGLVGAERAAAKIAKKGLPDSALVCRGGTCMAERLKEILVDEAYLSEIERRSKAATPGPWTSFIEGRDNVSGSSFIRTASEDIGLSGATDADQDFIAHARQDVVLLLSEVRRLRKLAGLA